MFWIIIQLNRTIQLRDIQLSGVHCIQVDIEALIPSFSLPLFKEWKAGIPERCKLWQTGRSTVICQKSYYDSAHICPIRAEISNYEYWENVFILLFVWLAVIGFRQNYFHISPDFGDFWAKMSFFSLYNQPKTENIYKTLLPPVFQNTTYIRDVYLYNKQSV